MYLDKTKKSFNFQIVESSEDKMNLKTKAANKLDMVLEKKDSKKSNNKEEDANMIENNYEEKVDEMYKKKMNYVAEEEVDEMYKRDIKEADQINRIKFEEIEDEETSIIEKMRKKKIQFDTLLICEAFKLNLFKEQE
ncbi:10680_t:CDS:2, partial [Cetraspora pellucida]